MSPADVVTANLTGALLVQSAVQLAALVRDAVAFERAETLQRKGDRIHARPQIDDLELPLLIADDRSCPFDQRGTCRFHGYARKYGTGVVLDDSRDGTITLG